MAQKPYNGLLNSLYSQSPGLLGGMNALANSQNQIAGSNYGLLSGYRAQDGGLPLLHTSGPEAGSHTTEYSVTLTHPRLNGGKPTNVPSFWGGKILQNEDQIVEMALKSGRKFQSFGSIAEAEKAAVARSAFLGQLGDAGK